MTADPMRLYRLYYESQPRGVRRLLSRLCSDERHVLVVGQTGSGKTTLVKAMLGAWGDSFTVLDFNCEYPWGESVERRVRGDALPLFLRLSEPTLPQELLYLVLECERSVEALLRGGLTRVLGEIYDVRVLNALRLRVNAFSALKGHGYSLPVVREVGEGPRMPLALAVLADRLLDPGRELLVVEEAQYFQRDCLSFLAAEGRKRGKKLAFITNDVESVAPAIMHNSVVLVFRSLPRAFWELGIPRPVALRRGEFLVVDPEDSKLRKFKLRFPWD